MRLVHGHHGRVAGIVEHFAATAHERIRRFGLEGMVEVADRPYRAGRSKDWVKVKNRKHPAYRRVQDRF
jgi:ATP-dependent DNA ligase